MSLMWLTKQNKLAKKYDKNWPTKVDSHDIDKYKRDKYGYGLGGRNKANL
jgi:hypothetical protein